MLPPAPPSPRTPGASSPRSRTATATATATATGGGTLALSQPSRWAREEDRFSYQERLRKPRAPDPGYYDVHDTTLYVGDTSYPLTSVDFLTNQRKTRNHRRFHGDGVGGAGRWGACHCASIRPPAHRCAPDHASAHRAALHPTPKGVPPPGTYDAASCFTTTSDGTGVYTNANTRPSRWTKDEGRFAYLERAPAQHRPAVKHHYEPAAAGSQRNARRLMSSPRGVSLGSGGLLPRMSGRALLQAVRA